MSDGMEIIEQDDGSLLIGTQQQVGNEVTVEVDGVIGAPWAVDAAGEPVPTSYAVGNDGSITMRVELCGLHNAAIRAASRYGYCQLWQINIITRSMSVGVYRGGFCR